MKLLKVTGFIVAVIVVLLAVAAAMLNSDAVQNHLMQRAVAMLREQLQTEVRVGHVSVNLFKGSLALHDVEVDDRQGRKMLRMERLTAALDPAALWRREVVITNAHADGLKALLCKPAAPTDSAPNFHFLVEAFKSPKTHSSRKARPAQRPFSLRLETATIDIDSLCYTTDNGRPRRNTGKPHHGAFDAGHLDLCAAMTVTVSGAGKHQPLHCELSVLNLTDRGSGLRVDSVRLRADLLGDSLRLSDVSIRMPHTTLTFAEGWVVLPDLSAGRTLSYSAPAVTAVTQIRDIAQPFAPVLKNFTTPLHVRCALSGNADGMDFGGVRVQSADRRLDISATGRLRHLRGKHLLHVHFDVSQMTALSGMAERIVNHFAVKKHMMKQLRALGRIGYRGHFDVVYKKESFAGRLRTDHGNIDFHFDIDERNKYLSGTASTDSLQLGRIMDMKELGRIACRAAFRFDISKPRTAQMRRVRGGKLPIGNVEAQVSECHYKFLSMHHLSATIDSDGAEATGRVVEQGKLVDLACNFSFTDTDQMHHLKVKPGIRFHRKSKKATVGP